MRTKMLFAATVFPMVLLLLSQAGAQDANSARAFLNSAYEHYGKGGKGVSLTRQYFHSSLLVLMDADAKAEAVNHDSVGPLDGDPLCDCQEWDGIWDLKIDVKMESPRRAIAHVSFALSPPKDRSKDDWRTLDVTLISEHGEWRIYDVVSMRKPDAPWRLRKELQRDIDELARAAKTETSR